MMIRAGRPGLLGTVARTAVVAGTAQAVAARVNRRQQLRWAEEGAAAPVAAAAPAAAPPPAPIAPEPGTASDAGDLVEALRGLAELHDQGVLTDAEFEAQKARILG